MAMANIIFLHFSVALNGSLGSCNFCKEVKKGLPLQLVTQF